MRLAPASLLALLVFAAPASAQWNRSPAGAPICTAFADQHRPVSIADGTGGAFVAWVDLRNSVSYDLYMNHVTAAGTVTWGAPGVVLCTASGIQDMPQLAADGAGGVIATWEDARSGNYDIYAQRLNGAGIPQWTANGVAVCNVTGDQYTPQLVADGTNGAIIAWTDFRGGTNSDIYAQHLTGAGAKLWTATGVALCTATGDQDSPALVSDGAGGALCAWTDTRNGVNQALFARRITGTGIPQWAANGVALTPAAAANGDQVAPVAIADGAGGLIAAWADHRGTSFDIFAQRVNGSGTLLWGAAGDSVCTAPDDQQYPSLVSDSSGGAFVAWEDARKGTDLDVYAQRVDSAGVLGWNGTNGAAVCTATGAQLEPHVARDGLGGVLVAWQDSRGSDFDIYAQRLNATGAAAFATDGIAVCNASGAQIDPSVCATPAGGMLVFWEDGRNGPTDIYGHRVLPYGSGALGSAEPQLAGFVDVPNDGGGFLTLSFIASIFENPALGQPLGGYRIMQVTPAGELPVLDVGNTGAASYSVVVPTRSDSIVGAAFPRTVYAVWSLDTTLALRLRSVPDSSYSVDNQAPAPPSGVAALIVNGVAQLHWQRNTEPDLKNYRVYVGDGQPSINFGTVLVATRTDTSYSQVLAAGLYYKLTAVDTHGNESATVVVQPEATLSVPGTVAVAFLARPSPNPSRDRTVLRFGITREQSVQLVLFDQQGRRIRTLSTGTLAPGEHVLAWDGRDDAGRAVAPGLYFAGVRLDGVEYRQRVVLIR